MFNGADVPEFDSSHPLHEQIARDPGVRCGPSQRCREGGSGGEGGSYARADISASSPAPNTDPSVCLEEWGEGRCNVTGREGLHNVHT